MGMSTLDLTIASAAALAVIGLVAIAVALLSPARGDDLAARPADPPGPPADVPDDQLGVYYWTIGPRGEVVGWLEIRDLLALARAEGCGVDFDTGSQRATLTL